MDDDPTTQNRLFADFPAATADDWRRLASIQLQGEPFEKKLVTRTPEGVPIQPIYHSGEGSPTEPPLPGDGGSVRGSDIGGYRVRPWAVAQEFPCGDPATFNTAALSDLKRGQSALRMILDFATANRLDADSGQSGEVAAGGLSLSCLRDVETALAGIDLESVPLHVAGGAAGLPLLGLFLAASAGRLQGSVTADPHGLLAREGGLPVSLDALYDELVVMVEGCGSDPTRLRTIGVDGGVFHEAGASATEELGLALASAVEYLRALDKRGCPPDRAAASMLFSFRIGSALFTEAAKFRAARLLWNRVMETTGVAVGDAPLAIHARTGLFNKTATDPYVNLLRSTTEAFSAVVGGVQSLHVGPFDEVIRPADEFSRRIARNTQTILREECELTATIDPGGGSYYLESLTEAIAEEAWTWFQEIEKAGGYVSALRQGIPQDRVSATLQDRSKRLSQRRTVQVGTNLYPNLDEMPLSAPQYDFEKAHADRAAAVAGARPDRGALPLDELGQSPNVGKVAAAAGAGATLQQIAEALTPRDAGPPAPSCKPFAAVRLAAPYESLRTASRQYQDETGSRPRIFLANLGPVRRHKIRADFTKGFFQPAGFEVIDPGGYEDAAAAAAAAAESGARIAVICGTDDAYVAAVPLLAQSLKKAAPDTWLILAGHPGENEAGFRDAGLDDYIHIRSNHLDVLVATLRRAGVSV